MVVAAVGAAVVGGVATTVAGNKAAKASKHGADVAAANEKYFYDTSRADFAPYREVGTAALGKLADMYGVPREIAPPANDTAQSSIPTLYGVSGGLSGFSGLAGYGVPSVPGATTPPRQMTPGYDGFQASPGYQFRLSEGVKAAERSAAARGLLQSGGTMKAIQRYGEGLASSEYENFANRLASLAGVGQTATNATTAAGQSAANGISQAVTNAGNARASAYANTGASINNGISNAMRGYLYSQGGGGGGGFGGVGAYGIAGSDGIY